jgi:hypothetical protein
MTDTTTPLEQQPLASRIGSAAIYVMGATAALASAYRANAGSTVLPLGWLLWVAGPYLLLGLAGDAIARRPGSRARHRALLLSSMAALLFTLYLYQGIWHGPHHSTEGLIFIFAPGWIVVATAVVFALVWWLWRARTAAPNDQPHPHRTGGT